MHDVSGDPLQCYIMIEIWHFYQTGAWLPMSLSYENRIAMQEYGAGMYMKKKW